MIELKIGGNFFFQKPETLKGDKKFLFFIMRILKGFLNGCDNQNQQFSHKKWESPNIG